MNYKETIMLPRTALPMRANLPTLEPKILEKWNQGQLYAKILEKRANSPEYIFHDGPPYADEHTHIGTAFNRILKDIIVKYKTMAGYKVNFIPGWDCHGMPIEHKVTKNLGPQAKDLSKKELRQKCKEFAQKFINIQKQEFQRLGEFGDWNNPYITMDPRYEARIIDTFKILAQRGYIYRDRRPVHWCTKCKTALAEAELEYQEISSSSLFVKFKVLNPANRGVPTFILIWTTTPWTLPANVACALNPEFKYDFVLWERSPDLDEILILAGALRESVLEKLGIKDYEIVKSVSGKELEQIKYTHPLFDKTCRVILSDFVSKESGTGCVHIAPGHGYEDYQAGIKYDLPIISPVDEEGKFTAEVPFLEGKYVFDTDEDIIKLLQGRGLLLKYEEFMHSYPHCWRCKTPLIFRATPQWFLSIDHNGLRQRCIEEIENVKWLPAWSKERILNSIHERPDWCLSRQRSWGVPIPVVYCKKCGTPVLSPAIMEKTIELIEKKGSSWWFEHGAVQELSASGGLEPCTKCACKDFIKEEDIFDVWFESSSSYKAVVSERLKLPADLYCEAVDQHRGWFQHSLILSMVTEDKPCFKSVLTHGLILDKERKKMSKSLGNIISPNNIINKYGADILRLHLASLDYTNDVPFDTDGLSAAGIIYRKLRNTFKFLLGNLYDFDYRHQEMPPTIEIDKLMLHRLTLLIERVKKAYANFEFYKVCNLIHQYCVLELSKFYFDILKDRLYTYGKNSIERRSAQTVLYEIFDALIRLIAPILPFTAEEVWSCFKQEQSIHFELLPEVHMEWINEKLANEYKLIEDIREDVLLGLEKARQARLGAESLIGNPLEAKVTVWTEDKELLHFLEQKLELLPDIFIVSEVSIDKVPGMIEEKKLSIKVEPCQYERCERCWKRTKDVGKDMEYPTLCAKCKSVIKGGDYETQGI